MLFRSAKRTLKASDCNWLTDFPVEEPTRAEVQVRYNSSPTAAEVTRYPTGDFDVRFEEDVFGVSPGQLAAIFQGSRAIGCGWIA